MTQDDRALLEAAAKAAGMEGWTYCEWDNCMQSPARDTNYGPAHSYWSPLTDDGDALRLAVKLGLFFKPEVMHFLSLERFAAQDRDDCYAYRRAITRAAASLAKEPTP